MNCESVLRGLISRILPTASKGFLGLSDQLLVSLASFATGMLIGRTCTKEELGLYALGLTIMVFATDFQTAFISTPYMVYSPRLEGYSLRQYTGSTLIHQLTYSFLVMLILIIGMTALSFGIGPKEFAEVSRAIILAITFVMLKEFIRQLCFASLRVKTALILDSFVLLLQVGGLLLLARAGVLSADRSFLAVGIACGLISVVWLILNRNIFVLSLKKAWAEFRRNWVFARWLAASNLLWSFAFSLFPWFIAVFQGVEANGIWAACMGVAGLGNLILVGTQNLVGPRILHAFAHGGTSEMRGLVLKATGVLVLLTSIFFGFILIFGDMLIVVLYGHKYSGNSLIISLMALNLVVGSATFPFSRGLFAMERADVDFKINIAVVATLGLSVYLVRTFGLVGAIYGLLAANSLSALLRGIVFNRIARTRIVAVEIAAV
jgi:O-antigen/teichoic acid export membrane protein